MQQDKDLVLNLDRIKDTPIEKLTKEEKISLALVLLKQMQPYLSSQNMAVAPPVANVTPLNLHKGSESSLLSSVKKQNRGASTTRAVKKNLFGDNDEGGLTRILNNVNVQTRKDSSVLPPIK